MHRLAELRWFLAYTLIKNPKIIQYRVRPSRDDYSHFTIQQINTLENIQRTAVSGNARGGVLKSNGLVSPSEYDKNDLKGIALEALHRRQKMSDISENISNVEGEVASPDKNYRKSKSDVQDGVSSRPTRAVIKTLSERYDSTSDSNRTDMSGSKTKEEKSESRLSDKNVTKNRGEKNESHVSSRTLEKNNSKSKGERNEVNIGTRTPDKNIPKNKNEIGLDATNQKRGGDKVITTAKSSVAGTMI